MASTMDQIASEALGLPTRSRALLVENLLASLSGESNPAVERAQLDEVRRRRDTVSPGQGEMIDGEEGLRRARAMTFRFNDIAAGQHYCRQVPQLSIYSFTKLHLCKVTACLYCFLDKL